MSSQVQNPMSNKPQAASHMFWFFILPCVLFLFWASFKLVNVALQPATKKDVFVRLTEIRAAKTSGDRWQAAYGVTQELQRLMHEKELEKFPEEKKSKLYSELNDLLRILSTDSRLKRYLLLTLGQMGDVRALPSLEEGLKDKDPEIRFFSAWGYIDILSKNPQVANQERIGLVKSWLNDGDPALKKISASFLVQQKNFPAMVGEVEKQLHDADIEVRWNAAVALASIGKSEAKSTLIECFDLKKLRDFSPKSAKDLNQVVAAAYGAAKKLNDPELLKKAAALRAQVNPSSPEGRAILSALN